MTAPHSGAMTPSRSLAENLANAHITTNGSETPGQSTHDNEEAQASRGRPPVITPGPLHQEQADKDSFELKKQGGFYVLPKSTLPAKEKFGPVEEFVAKAVKGRLETSGDASAMQAYKVIIEAINKKKNASLLQMMFLAIRTAANGSTLHQLSSNPTKHAQLLHSLLRFDPFTNKATGKDQENDSFRNYSMADAYLNSILALVSANSVFVVPAMTSLWKLLTTITTANPPAAKTQRIHATLAAMIRLCPKSKTEIYQVISSNVPFRTRSEKELVWCYKQIFAIASYVPSIQSQVLKFVIDRCLEMDVEIKIHDGGEVTLDDDKDQNDDIFELELDTVKTPEKNRGDVSVDEMADKLDALMLLTLQYLEDNGQSDILQARALYEGCLPAFESSILITHRSKFVQFILFYLCGLESKALTVSDSTHRTNHNQQHATLYREFCAGLIGIIHDPFRARVVRQSAACYLASFVSRAQFAEADTICESLAALLGWAEVYMASRQGKSLSADARDQCDLHFVFYTICQAAFYIMCFRGEEALKFFRAVEELESQPAELIPEHLQEVELKHVDISATRWSRLCGHPLQPLRYCLETVREEFLNVATTFNLLDNSLLQRLDAERDRQASGLRKKRANVIKTAATLQVARRNGGVGGLGKGSNPLDSFFPFDPYLLRRSHPFIEPFYRNWGDNNGIDEDGPDAMDHEDTASDASEQSSDDESYSSDEGEVRRERGSVDHMVSSTPPRPPTVLAAPREAWTETLKRNRAPSIENGSW